MYIPRIAWVLRKRLGYIITSIFVTDPLTDDDVEKYQPYACAIRLNRQMVKNEMT